MAITFLGEGRLQFRGKLSLGESSEIGSRGNSDPVSLLSRTPRISPRVTHGEFYFIRFLRIDQREEKGASNWKSVFPFPRQVRVPFS